MSPRHAPVAPARAPRRPRRSPAGGARGRPAGITPAQARRESARARRQRTEEILARLRREYPDSRTALDHHDAYELLVATILSAQCTDKRVNEVTPALFRRFPSPRELAAASLAELEELVRTTGFYHNKARALLGLGQALVSEHGGQVPDTMEELRRLPGVGRKTANVVLGNAFGRNVGVVVDTHVQRLTRRLGLTVESDPEKIERDLMALVPQGDWAIWSNLLIAHGRKVCQARRPLCASCVIADLCPSAEI
ncbi:MAG TPA: endonuclease III [Thermoanaerobaculia bacterium]|nr:endonuclease III [Thermoanaerobaculia bacterium]